MSLITTNMSKETLQTDVSKVFNGLKMFLSDVKVCLGIFQMQMVSYKTKVMSSSIFKPKRIQLLMMTFDINNRTLTFTT